MAVSSFQDYLYSIRDRYAKFVSDGILEHTPLWKEIQRANGPPKRYGGIIGGMGGIFKSLHSDAIQWRILTSLMQVSTWGPGSDIRSKTPNLLGQARVTVGGYVLSYNFPLFEQMTLGGEEQIVDLIRLYERMAARTWAQTFEEKAHLDELGLNPPGWGGLATFMKTSGTYAQYIDLSQSYAKPTVFDYSGSGQQFELTALDRLTEVINNATHGDVDGETSSPAFGLMNRSDWQKVKNLIEDSRHIVDVDTETLKLGFRHFVYDGVRFYWSDPMSKLGINRVYLLNPRYIAVAHAGASLFRPMQGFAIEGILGQVYVSVHKGQIFCTNTRFQAMIDNTDKS